MTPFSDASSFLHPALPELASDQRAIPRGRDKVLGDTVEAVVRIRFWWDATHSICRATAHDVQDRLLGEITIAVPELTRQRLFSVQGASARFRMEEIAERHLRTMLDLRY